MNAALAILASVPIVALFVVIALFAPREPRCRQDKEAP